MSLGVVSGAMADERLDLLKEISISGAPELTLKMLDQAQPSFDENLYEWILWEQERLAILSQWQQWDELLVRIEKLPSDIPYEFARQVVTYQARAYLAQGQTVAARQVLRQKLWRTDADEGPDYETWRQQVIESYIADERIDDARIAMLRFDQDFENTDLDWLILRASVLIKAGRFEQAILVLEGQETWQAKTTSTLASFRLGEIDQGEVWQQVEQRSKDETVGDEERATLWALAYFAAQQMSPVDRVVALETMFRMEASPPLQLFQVPVDVLWKAYIDYAVLVGNRAEFLLGDDEKWLKLADKSKQATPVKARSLYAMLILESADSEITSRAATGYMETFAEVDDAERNLLENLFNRSQAFASARKIPPGIRYELVDLALRSSDIEEATRLMSGLTTIPEGTSRFDWQLRQSRVLILGGRYDEGSEVLENLISEYEEVTPESTDRILQVLFDLQTVDQHAEAITHFNQLLRLKIEPKQRREILYWIADSHRGLEKYEQAALLYLQSAMLPAPDSMDPWAQTARYSAAGSLQDAGLIDDARRIYESLLEVTEDAARRSVLSHRIQRLWLYQGAQ